MSHNYRCSVRACRARRTLRKPIAQYVRRPKCPSCGANSLKDRTRTERARTRRRVCNCGEMPYPHTKGSEPWCTHAVRGPTEDDYRGRCR